MQYEESRRFLEEPYRKFHTLSISLLDEMVEKDMALPALHRLLHPSEVPTTVHDISPLEVRGKGLLVMQGRNEAASNVRAHQTGCTISVPSATSSPPRFKRTLPPQTHLLKHNAASPHALPVLSLRTGRVQWHGPGFCVT